MMVRSQFLFCSQALARYCVIRHLATRRLSEEECLIALAPLSLGPFAWNKLNDRDAIQKTFTFRDFKEAWRFMSEVAVLAEDMDHHPEWFNVYNTVQVTLTTHDCSGVSEKDIEMAKQMDLFAASILPNQSS